MLAEMIAGRRTLVALSVLLALDGGCYLLAPYVPAGTEDARADRGAIDALADLRHEASGADGTGGDGGGPRVDGTQASDANQASDGGPGADADSAADAAADSGPGDAAGDAADVGPADAGQNDTSPADLGPSDTGPSPCQLATAQPLTVDVVICQAMTSRTQCSASQLCSAVEGWTMCTASQYQQRIGTSVIPGTTAWIAGCVRQGLNPSAPSDAVCPGCTQATEGMAWVSWLCDGSGDQGNIERFVGLVTHPECRRVGSNKKQNEANWNAEVIGRPGIHATVCCK